MNKSVLTLLAIGGGGVALYFALRPRTVQGGPANAVQGAGPVQGAYPGYPGPAVVNPNNSQQNSGTNWGSIFAGLGSAVGSIASAFSLGKGSAGSNNTSVPSTSVTLPNYQLTDPTLSWGTNAGGGWASGASYTDNLGFGLGNLSLDPTMGL